MFLTVVSESQSKCDMVVTKFCRDNNIVFVNDLIQIICDYYDLIDHFDESCKSKHLTITNPERTQIRVNGFYQRSKCWDDCELKFICGTKTYFINNTKTENNNTEGINHFANHNTSNNNNTQSRNGSMRSNCKLKWNLLIDGRYRGSYNINKIKSGHVCCGIGIMNVNDTGKLQRDLSKKYISQPSQLRISKYCSPFGPFVSHSFIGFACCKIDIFYNLDKFDQNVHSFMDINCIKSHEFNKKVTMNPYPSSWHDNCRLYDQPMNDKKDIKIYKGDKIELSIDYENKVPYLYLKRKSNQYIYDSEQFTNDLIDEKTNKRYYRAWTVMKQSIENIKSGQYKLIVWLKDPKTKITIL